MDVYAAKEPLNICHMFFYPIYEDIRQTNLYPYLEPHSRNSDDACIRLLQASECHNSIRQIANFPLLASQWHTK